MDNKYVAIDRVQMDELIDSLKFLQLDILSMLKNDKNGGLIKSLESLTQRISKINDEIETGETNVTNNLIILRKILEKIELSESTSELRLINANDQFQKEITKIKDELAEDFKKKIGEINERIKNINLKTLEAASNNTTTAINRLNNLYITTKDINNNLQSKLKITSLILSFMGGSILTSIFFYFFI